MGLFVKAINLIESIVLCTKSAAGTDNADSWSAPKIKFTAFHVSKREADDLVQEFGECWTT